MWSLGSDPANVSIAIATNSSQPSTLQLSSTKSLSPTTVQPLNLSGLQQLTDLSITSLDLTAAMTTPGAFLLPANLTSLTLTDCKLASLVLPQSLSSLQSLTIESSQFTSIGLAALNQSSVRTVQDVNITDMTLFGRTLRHMHRLESLDLMGTNFTQYPVSNITFMGLLRIPHLALDPLPDDFQCSYYAHKLRVGNTALCVYHPGHGPHQENQTMIQITAWIILVSMTATVLYCVYCRCRGKRRARAPRSTTDAVIDSLLDSASQQAPQSSLHGRPGDTNVDTSLRRSKLRTVEAAEITNRVVLYNQGPHIHVARGVYTRDQSPVLLKHMAGYESYLIGIARTIADLAALDHPHIAPLRGLVATEPSALAVFIRDVGPAQPVYERGLADNEKRKVAADVARALAYLHSVHHVHGCLTAATVLIDDTGDALLNPLDLLASHVYATHSTDALYVAPEVILQAKGAARADEDARRVRFASPAADVYSFGVLLAEIDMDESAMSYLTRKCLSFQDKEMPVAQLVGLRHALTFFRGQFQLVVAQCLHEDPSSRPSMSRVLDLLTEPPPAMLEEDAVPHLA
ncbi:hypothetical protein ACHHYP_10626 [Achlya hypogyna]|uniref:Protein kinase domain-containing protein n=1 Tax=Achlya hypogyna TaxID=1202772 RepID=A0A1V9YL14_ACHHY|nr:hypothetical protein ACHHYP_10626 [Achlya hypogyna]